MTRRTLASATLLLVAFLVGRWSVGNQWITQTLQPVAAGLVDSTRGEGRDLLTDLDLRTVTRVIDGDTLVLNGAERVRLIGVDTPETVHPTKPVEYFGKEASAFTKRIVEGKQVYLEYELCSPPKTGTSAPSRKSTCPMARCSTRRSSSKATGTLTPSSRSRRWRSSGRHSEKHGLLVGGCGMELGPKIPRAPQGFHRMRGRELVSPRLWPRASAIEC